MINEYLFSNKTKHSSLALFSTTGDITHNKTHCSRMTRRLKVCFGLFCWHWERERERERELTGSAAACCSTTDSPVFCPANFCQLQSYLNHRPPPLPPSLPPPLIWPRPRGEQLPTSGQSVNISLSPAQSKQLKKTLLAEGGGGTDNQKLFGFWNAKMRFWGNGERAINLKSGDVCVYN